AKVTDASSNPAPNVTVTFTAPASGASAIFGGSNTVSAVTNASGIAVSPVPTANSVAGTYTVTASVTGLAPANFNLTNTTTASSYFGDTIIGASSTPFGGLLWYNGKYAPSSNCSATRIELYTDDITSNFTFGIYSYNAATNGPGTVLV